MWETNISKENVIIPSYVHCISFRWYGEKKIHTISQIDFPLWKKDIHNDIEVLKAFSKIAEQADILVAHNGDKFDLRKFNGRLLLQGLKPIPVRKTIDTLKIARKYFKLDWNNLDYLAKTLGYKGKMENPKGLWKDCFFGVVSAMKHMAKYNRQDIDILEFVFEKLMPFERSPLLRASADVVCQNVLCGSSDVQFRGARANTHSFQCNSCHKWGHIKIT